MKIDSQIKDSELKTEAQKELEEFKKNLTDNKEAIL
jgi:hypothetical protein